MRTLLNLTMFLFCGLALGYCTADYSMQEGLASVSVRNGSWVTWPSAGSTNADPYTRAHFAASGHLPLTAFEAVTYRADTDDTGEGLDQSCEYIVEGRAPNARWWSLTAYAKDLRTMKNPAGRYSFNSRNLVFTAQGEFRIVLAADARPGNWLPLQKSGGFQLTFRLYNPDPEIRNNPSDADLPKIKKVVCQ